MNLVAVLFPSCCFSFLHRWWHVRLHFSLYVWEIEFWHSKERSSWYILIL